MRIGIGRGRKKGTGTSCRQPLSALGCAIVIGLLGVSQGCGTGAYQDRLDARVQQLGTAAQFSVLYDAPLTLPGTTALVRIPRKFTVVYDASTPDPDGGGSAIDTRRVQPSFLPLPSLKACYEGFEVDNSNNGNNGIRLPTYCYLAAPTAADVPQGKQLAEMLRESLAAKFGGASWEEVQCPSPSGPPVTCKRIRVSGPQEFYTGPGQYTEMAGTFILYLHEGPGQPVLVGFRTPDSVAEKANFDSLSQLTAGTIVVAPPAAG